MALYYYQAFSKDGNKTTGYLDASSEQAVKEQLAKQGMFPISIVLSQPDARQSWWERIFSRGISTKDKILFTKQMATLLKSGVPLLQSLELLTEQFTGGLKVMLVNVKDQVKEGRSFADALKEYPKVFENIYVQLVRAGEASGQLEVILERLTEYLERRQEIAKRIRGALMAPLMQLGVAVLVVVGLLTYVVPQMADTFSQLGKELPASTLFLMACSNFILHRYIILLIILITIVVSIRYWLSTKTGARQWDQIKLRIPLVNHFTRMNAVVQFCQTLGMLTASGVNLAEALDIVCSIIDNRILADTLQEARDKIIKQGKIAQYLKQTKLFPPIAIYLINTGEQTGALDTMLLTVASNYEEDLKELSDGLAAALGPILLIAMAVIVGFIAMAIATPMMEMSDIPGME